MARILIVEDDANLREAYISILEIEGYSSIGAESVVGAIECLSKTVPDVVFLDVHLMDGSGRMVISYIQRMSRLSHTKIVLVSGYTDLRTQAIKNWGVDLFLAKPFTVADLQSALSQLNIIPARSPEIRGQHLALPA